MSDLVVVNNLPAESISELVRKVRKDLNHGVKVFGNEANRSDTIRVWTKSNIEIFGIVTTSGNRFESTLNLLEIQSFNTKPYFKLTVFLGDSEKVKHTAKIVKLNDNFLEQDGQVSQTEAQNFMKEYLQSKPDFELTKTNFEKYAYNPKQYKWINKP